MSNVTCEYNRRKCKTLVKQDMTELGLDHSACLKCHGFILRVKIQVLSYKHP